MPQIIKKQENFLGIYTFHYNSYKAHVDLDTIHNRHMSKTINFNIESDEENPIKYGYKPGKGLVKFNQYNGSIEDTNVLGELLSTDDKEPKKLAKFFMSYGSLFYNEKFSFTKFEFTTLTKVVDRLRWCVELMSQICEPKTRNYKKLLKLILCLFFGPDIEIRNHNKALFYQRKHELKDELTTHVVSGSSYQFLGQSTDQLDENDYNRLTSSSFEFGDDIFGNQTIAYTDYEKYMDQSPYIPQTLNALAFLHFEDRNNKHIILWDLLFHFFKEYPELLISIKNFDFDKYDSSEIKIDDIYKEAIIRVAKGMLATEINAHIKNVRPYYMFDALEPSWQVNDLITALYLSLFYMKPNVELVRKCQNPNCNNYFIVNTSSTRTKYCCTNCGNAMSQARYRTNHKYGK